MRRLASFFILPLLAFGCGSPTDVDVPDRAPSISGSIVSVGGRQTTLGLTTVHVKTNEGDNCGIVFTVMRSTRIVTPSDAGSDYQNTDIDALVVGRSARVWAKGNTVLTSCPGQATAEVIEIST
jgi:hypothetical protein